MRQALLFRRGTTALMLAAAVPAVMGAQSQVPAATPLVFDSATVVDVEQGKLVPDQRVVVVGNHIQAMGTASQVAAPQGAKVVNARGKYLIPGLWDMHIHPLDQADAFFPLMLANGITGFRDAASTMPIDTLRRWRQEVLDSKRVGPPRQILSTKAIDEAHGTWWIPTFIIAAQHGDFESKGKATQPGYARLDSLVAKYWDDGTVNRYAFGGLGEFEDAAPDEEATGTPGAASPDSTTRQKREHNSNALLADSVGRLVIAQRVGMPILIGTDATPTDLQTLTPGFALHAEMAVSVGEGLTPLNTLQAVTLNPAKLLHATDSLGTVAPGKLADLVLLDADPLADITNTTRIRAVVANGRYYDRAALDRLLAGVRAEH